jgi:large subunit ribosomal protein L6
MSRIGNKVINIPAGVKVDMATGSVKVAGPKGKLSRPIVNHVNLNVEGSVLSVARTANHKQARANHGLMRALLNNMVIGVTTGFSKRMELHGIGYKADVRGKQLVLNLGYSHPINFDTPDGIKIETIKAKVPTFVISGIDKEQVGQVAAVIRSFRKPDAYKGKGVRYSGEVVRLKQGKGK